jgi:ammonia channel protein AmtB
MKRSLVLYLVTLVFWWGWMCFSSGSSPRISSQLRSAT